MRLIPKIVLNFAVFAFCTISIPFIAHAQSTDANFPTAVSSNEIEGLIKARDIGDSRVTSYFYTFDGGQGDVFINVVAKNFNGDIDVFAAEALRPLTKMVMYADAGESETGRIVYLRKPERLILRVEGRSPNDDPAIFKIKFAGSFIALAPQKPQDIPTIKTSEAVAESGIRVNSVGTIVEVLPKAPAPAEERRIATVAASKEKEKEKEKETKAPAKKPVVVVTEPPTTERPAEKKPAPTKPPVKTPPAKKPAPASKTPKKPEGPEVSTVFKKSAKPKSTAAEKPPQKPLKTPAPPEEVKPDPMASIRLVVQLKDGNVIERPMNEVTKFSVDKGVLTVVAKDGSTVKYSILDVAKVTIE